jgi:hypothetical protein
VQSFVGLPSQHLPTDTGFMAHRHAKPPRLRKLNTRGSLPAARRRASAPRSMLL